MRRQLYHGVCHTCAAFLLAAAAVFASQGSLDCNNRVISGLPVTDYCTSQGSVLAGRNISYSFEVPANPDFDLSVFLISRSGDADLEIHAPNEATAAKASNHGTGKDVLYYSKRELTAAPGLYTIYVKGFAPSTVYQLELQTTVPSAPLHPDDRAVLEEVLSMCCSDPTQCPDLRKGLNTESLMDVCATVPNVCDAEGHVVQLVQIGQQLTCAFPTPLARLPRLKHLDLTFNVLTGRLDTDVGPAMAALPQLETLALGFNKLKGPIPCELAGPALVQLDLTSNLAEGAIPGCLFQSRPLRELYLALNRLGGEFPTADLPANSGLSMLAISAQGGGGVSGGLPDMSGWANLTGFMARGNQLSGSLPRLPGSIKEVHLNYNQFSGSIPDGWGSLDKVDLVRIENNQLEGGLPAGLAMSPTLKLLDASFNRLAQPLPATWQAPALQMLDVHANQIPGPLPGSLAALPSLVYLQAQDNQLSGTLDSVAEELEAANATSQLKYFNIGGNQLEGEVPEALAQMAVFEGGDWIVLDGNALLPKTFNISHNRFGGPFPAWLVQELTEQLFAANLEGNSFTCPEAVYVTSEVDPTRVAAGSGFVCTPVGSQAGGGQVAVYGLVVVDPQRASQLHPPEPPAAPPQEEAAPAPEEAPILALAPEAQAEAATVVEGDAPAAAPEPAPAPAAVEEKMPIDRTPTQSGGAQSGDSTASVQTADAGRQRGESAATASSSGLQEAAPQSKASSASLSSGGIIFIVLAAAVAAVAALALAVVARHRLRARRAGRYQRYGKDESSLGARGLEQPMVAGLEMTSSDANTLSTPTSADAAAAGRRGDEMA